MRYSLYFICFCLLNCVYNSNGYSNYPYRENSIKAQGYYAQGLEYEKNKEWRLAVMQFDKAATLTPGYSRLYIHLAWCLIQLGDCKQALEMTAQAEKYMDDQDYLLYFDLGNVYREVKEIEKAKKCYRTTLKIYPNFVKGKQALLDISEKQGENDEKN